MFAGKNGDGGTARSEVAAKSAIDILADSNQRRACPLILWEARLNDTAAQNPPPKPSTYWAMAVKPDGPFRPPSAAIARKGTTIHLPGAFAPSFIKTSRPNSIRNNWEIVSKPALM
ncbi:MAG: hypothetical protein GX425_18435 [Peptococcaceae bacterium]|nr:hypothetical protein [Peptococcaceae bacterium]